ncbi:hypothetical protein [Magnetospirillum sp. SS-4]|uniref:hypothetical protein n=1 Tax=Magnetospirillum sp. SS-4 TaxID=2681465 RepID=UPI00137D7E46|nr:hypothetical protein [Magnetospirillum sp. SS-4]CAA7613750.1 conserved hypothetical protein [Magnetospirillum sp. SS-4]
MSASAILKLQSVGFSKEQVEALADFMDTQAASKADILTTEAKLYSAIADAKIDIIKWVVGMGLAQVGLVFAALKIFVH